MLTGADLGAAIELARIKKGISKKALADAFGVKPPSIQDWVKRGTIDKDKLQKLWEFFQDVAGPEHWGLSNWTDQQHPSGGAPVALVAHEMSPPPLHSRPHASKQVPVIGALAMGEKGMLLLKREPGGRPIGAVPVPLAPMAGYALQVQGDDLYPAIRHGTCLVVDPSSLPVVAELVLIQLQAGDYIVCELVADSADFVTWVPANGGGRRTIARDLVSSIHPVVSLVPGSQMK